MSEFKSRHPDRTLRIEPSITGDNLQFVANGPTDLVCVSFDPTNAPAIALAVLEAAGVVPEDVEDDAICSPEQSIKRAAYELSEATARLQAKAAAAAEEAEVEAEGAPFTGPLTGGNYAGQQLTLWIGRNPIEVQLGARVQVTGARVAPERQHLERNLPA